MRTLSFPEQTEYEKEKEDVPIIWSDAPESKIQEPLGEETLTRNVEADVPDYAKEVWGDEVEVSKLDIKRLRVSISSREELIVGSVKAGVISNAIDITELALSRPPPMKRELPRPLENEPRWRRL